MRKRLLILMVAIGATLLSHFLNIYYFDPILEELAIMSIVSSVMNRISLTCLIYFVIDYLVAALIHKQCYSFASVINAMFIIYMIAMIGLLFGRMRSSTIAYSFNFESYLPVWIDHLDIKLVAYYIYGNILLFIPLGFFFTYHFRMMAGTLLSMFTILLIEVLQGITGLGWFDIDDLLLNSVGGMFGSLLAIMTVYLRTMLKKA